MGTEIYKVLVFLKRRPGMTVAEFRTYYEEVHAKLCAKYAVGARRYLRRYVDPMPQPLTGATDEMDFDVITELWFDDRAVFDAVIKYAARGKLPPDVLADEEHLFDRARSRFATVIETETDLSISAT